MDASSQVFEFAGLHGRQATDDDYGGTRICPLCASDVLATLGRGSMSYATGVYDRQVGPMGGSNVAQAQLFEKLSDLLAFVLIYLAAESTYGKSLHNMVQCIAVGAD
jgi:hypothetical protein